MHTIIIDTKAGTASVVFAHSDNGMHQDRLIATLPSTDEGLRTATLVCNTLNGGNVGALNDISTKLLQMLEGSEE